MYIKVRVTTESNQESLEEKASDLFDVAVKEKAEAGRANTRVLGLLKQHFPKAKRLYIVSGHHSPHKIVSVELR